MLEECFLAGLLLGLFANKVLVCSYFIDLCLINTSEIDLLGSSDNIAGVDSAKRNTVDFEWTSDEENTLGDVLQEDDTLTTETTSEEDKDGTGSKS